MLYRLDDGHVSAEFKRADEVLRLLLHELYNSVLHGVDSEVCSNFHVLSRMNFSAALADDDFTSFHFGAIRALDAQAFSLRISAVSCRTLGKFMCHI